MSCNPLLCMSLDGPISSKGPVGMSGNTLRFSTMFKRYSVSWMHSMRYIECMYSTVLCTTCIVCTVCTVCTVCIVCTVCTVCSVYMYCVCCMHCVYHICTVCTVC